MTQDTTSWSHADLVAHLWQIADGHLELTPTQADFATAAAMWIYLGVDDAGIDLAMRTIANPISEEIDHLVEAATAFVAAKLDRDVS
jgi:hypothetical protein